MPENKIGGTLNFRWIPEKSDSGKIFSTLRFKIMEGLSGGLDYRPLSNDIDFAANWRAVSEKKGWQPAVIFGTSNDDFNEIKSQSYYGTVSKYLGELGNFQFSPYTGATYIEELGDLRPVAGLHIRNGAWSAMFSYSGANEHLSFSRLIGNHTASFIYWGLKYPGASWTFRF